MKLEDAAFIRTGAVLGRKKVDTGKKPSFIYKMLNLKCINPEGSIDSSCIEEYPAKEKLKQEFFTQKGDVLIRLSFPYTAILINKESHCNLLVPSHFAILRAKDKIVVPEYVLWFLRNDETYQRILQNSSGSTALGTISSGFIGSLNINLLPTEQQKALGQMLLLSDKEQELLYRLAKEKAIYNRIAIKKLYERLKGEE